MTPNLMPSNSIPDRSLPESARERADAPLMARLALMGELESSLHRSRKALLALDLAGIEEETSEQTRLIREFDTLLRRDTLTPAPERQAGKDVKAGWSAGTPGLEERLRPKAKGILDAVRLQAALVARAQGKLRVLANMLAGPSVIYGPILAGNGACPVFPAESEAERSDLCRA